MCFARGIARAYAELALALHTGICFVNNVNRQHVFAGATVDSEVGSDYRSEQIPNRVFQNETNTISKTS